MCVGSVVRVLCDCCMVSTVLYYCWSLLCVWVGGGGVGGVRTRMCVRVCSFHVFVLFDGW